MVPTGRLELPRIAPLAPQASVSTNSTTSAFRKSSARFFQGFAGACSTGSAGTGTALASTAGAGAGAGTAVLAGT